ncbi:armadillo-type protein [Hyaloraphidium curvatum]|nr:armadillo-type protein [Hyaloraphidium curvatum]
MDAQALAKVQEALELIFNPRTPNDQRVAAQKFTEEFKAQPSGPLFGYHLAHRNGGQSENVRHFGLGCIEYAIRFRWTEYGTDERTKLRDLVADLLRTGTDALVYQKKFLKEKLATIVVEIAKRMWPLEWTDFETLLQELYASGPGGQDLVLSILRSLGEDIYVFDNVVPGQRKKDLSTAITAVTVSRRIVDEVVAKPDNAALLQSIGLGPANDGWLAKWTLGMVALQAEYESAVRGGDKGRAEAAERLASSMIQTIAVTFEWVLLRAIIECQTVLRMFDALLSGSMKIRTAAAEALVVLFSRNLHQTDDNRQACILDPMFDAGGFEKMLQAWATAHGAGHQGLAAVGNVEMTKLVDDEADYQLAQRIVQAFAALGETHICFRKRAKSIPNGFDKYIQFMLVVSRHPSTIVSSIACQFWLEALKHEVVKETPELAAALPALLETIFARLMVLDHPESADPPYRHYNDIDFDSPSEMMVFFAQYKNKLLECARIIAALKPVETITWAATRIQVRLASKPGAGDFLVPDAPWLKALEADSLLFSSVVSAVPDGLLDQGKAQGQDNAGHTQIVAALVAVLQQLVAFDTQDPLIVRQQLPMIVSCAEAMAVQSDLLLQSLQKLFTFTTFRMPGEDPELAQRPESKELRYRALSSLVKLAIAIPNVLIQLYQDIAASIKNLVDQNLLREGEKTFLMEFAVCIVFNAAVPPESKIPHIHAIMEPYVSEFSSNVLANGPLLGAPSFLEFIGIGGMAQALAQAGSFQTSVPLLGPAIAKRAMDERQNRARLYALVNTFTSFLRRTVDVRGKAKSDAKLTDLVWNPYIPRIVPNLFRAIKVVHDAWDPQHWQGLPVELQYVLRMGLLEKKQAMGGSSFAPPLDDFADESLAKHLDNIRSWLVAYRESSYASLGLLTYLGEFFSVPDLSQMILQGLFGSAEVMENRHWKSLIGSAMRPMISNCPPQFLMKVLGPILPAFFTFLSNKLELEWKARMEKGTLVDEQEIEARTMDGDGSGAGSDFIEVEDMSEEIINEKVLRLLTRAYSDLMVSIFAPAPPAPRDGREAGRDKTPDGKRVPKVSNPIDDFLNKELVQFLITNMPIAQPLLLSLSNMVHYPDLLSARRTLGISSRLIPLLVKQGPSYHEYVAKELLVSALKALHDPYHTEAHGEIITLITEIYMALRPLTTLPLETFSQLPDVDASKIQQFESELGQKTQAKDQQAVVRAFLANFAGVAVSQLFGTKSSFALANVKKSVFRTLADRGNTHRNDLLSKDSSDGEENGGHGALNGLFG